MLAPLFTPLADAMDGCGDECAVGEGHDCKHGNTCPMHKKKGAGHAAHNDHAAHNGHSGHDSNHHDDAVHSGHAGHHDQAAIDDQEALICTVSDIGEKQDEPRKQRPCFIMSVCDHDNDPISVVFGADYLVSKSHFEPVNSAGSVKPFKYHQYQGPAPVLIERPPSA